MDPGRLMTVQGTVVSRIPSGEDRYGGALLAETRTSEKCWYSNPSTEERGGQVIQTLTVYFPPDAVLDHVTALELPGLGSWEIDGGPIPHISPRTKTPTHITVRVRRGG
jgi:hypothetical protein